MEWILEIETKKKIFHIKNPRKVKLKDGLISDIIQIMDNNNKWHNIRTDEAIWNQEYAKKLIKKAIKERKEYVNVSHYI